MSHKLRNIPKIEKGGLHKDSTLELHKDLHKELHKYLHNFWGVKTESSQWVNACAKWKLQNQV